MPIPFIIAGVVAGAIGVAGHASAKETNERAQKIAEEAQELYNDAKHELEIAQNKTQETLMKLGHSKKDVLDTSMNQFLETYEKIKHIQVKESVGIHEISKFSIDEQGAIQIREMTNIYSSSFSSSVTGVAAGATIALAASGALPVVTGELALASSALAAGEIGMAAGFAGSALSFGAAMTPLAAVAAPVLLFTGISASIKADENLEKAETMQAEAEEASEKMKIAETLCEAITKRSEMFDDLLKDLNKMFSECSKLLTAVVGQKVGDNLETKLTADDFSGNELKLIAVTRALAGAVKAVIDTPILSKDGDISYESKNVYDHTVEKMPDFIHTFEDVKAIDYHIKPIAEKTASMSGVSKGNSSGGTTVLGSARNVFAIILGVIFASVFTKALASGITKGISGFLFFNSLTANKIAIWLLLCSTVAMLVGKFRNTEAEKLCGLGTGLSLFILYVQYCRNMDQMNHPIIFSIIFCIICGAVFNFFDDKKHEFNFGMFLSMEFLIMALWPIGFFIYAFFSKFIGFPDTFCLVATSILFFLFSVFGMAGNLEDE